MKYFARALFLFALLISSCLSSDGDLDGIPDARISSIIFTDKATGAENTGTIVYEGPAMSPSKITVTWSGDLRLFRIPIVDTRTITKTIYELADGRVVRITNVNDAGVDARVEEFTYNASGYLTKQLVTEINAGGGGPGFLTYENDFYYNVNYVPDNPYYREAGAVHRVIQRRCNMTTCFDGVFDRISDTQFKSYIPAVINKTGHPLTYTFTHEPADESTFEGSSVSISRTTGQQGMFDAFVPIQMNYYNSFGLPAGSGESEYGALIFSKGNAEQLVDLYYVVGQWINPAYNKEDGMYDDETGAYKTGETYGVDNSSWIFPKLRMATTYANYVQFGFLLEDTERFLGVDFQTSIVK